MRDGIFLFFLVWVFTCSIPSVQGSPYYTDFLSLWVTFGPADLL